MSAFLSRLGRRLALPDAFGWPTFWIAAFVYFGTTVLFDARRFGGSLTLWILGWVIGQFILFVWVIGLKPFAESLNPHPKTKVAVVLFIGATAGVARGLAIGLFSSNFGLATQPQWWFRLGGGAVAGLVLTVAGAGLIGASVEHHNILAKLKQTRDALLRIRKAAPATLNKTRNEIAKLATETLVPRLKAIDKALTSTTESTLEIGKTADKIRALINQEVRPMSSSLAQRVEKTLSVTPKVPIKKSVQVGLPRRFVVADAISPGVTFAISLMLCLSTFVPLADQKSVVLSFVGAILLWLLLEGSVHWLAKMQPLPLAAGTAALVVIGAVSTIPLSLLTQWSLPKELNLSAMPIQSAFIMGVLVVGIGFTKLVDNERASFERELNEFNEELERELKWVDTQIWVIRREWAYLLHGRVQSALTAAIARIANGKNVDEETIRLVHQDMKRALTAISKGIGQQFKLEEALKEISDSWQGICELRFDFSAGAIDSVNEDFGLARSINELVREAVGNAVRHGNATFVTLELSEDSGLLVFRAINNGKPVTKKSRASLGTEMLDEVTLDWSLTNRHSPKRVVLEAKFAKATSSS